MHRVGNRRGYLHIALLGVIALGLAACSSTDTVALRPCPEILIPIDSAKLTRFIPGPGRDIIDVLHEEQLTGFAHRCEYDTDETGVGAVVIEIFPAFESARGPANAENLAQFEYYIAIADLNKTVLEKMRFPMAIPFPEYMSRVRWQSEEPIVLNIPLKAGQNGADFEVFIGLQMTRDELDYQKKIR